MNIVGRKNRIGYFFKKTTPTMVDSAKELSSQVQAGLVLKRLSILNIT